MYQFCVMFLRYLLRFHWIMFLILMQTTSLNKLMNRYTYRAILYVLNWLCNGCQWCATGLQPRCSCWQLLTIIDNYWWPVADKNCITCNCWQLLQVAGFRLWNCGVAGLWVVGCGLQGCRLQVTDYGLLQDISHKVDNDVRTMRTAKMKNSHVIENHKQ